MLHKTEDNFSSNSWTYQAFIAVLTHYHDRNIYY